MRITNTKSIVRIIEVLMSFPQGIWLRRLSKEAKIPPSTLHYYLSHQLSQLTQSTGAKNEEGNYFGIRVIRLKSGVLRRLTQGERIEDLIKESKTLSQ